MFFEQNILDIFKMVMNMEMDYRQLGIRVKTAREAKNLTQEQLSEKLGLSNNFISNIERGRSKPSLETLVKICTALDTTPDFLLLDSVFTYSSQEYIKDDIAKLIAKCKGKNIKIVVKVIETLINELPND